jgi:hypothetical protein
MIPNGSGQLNKIFDHIEEFLKTNEIPNITWKEEKSGGWDCIMVSHNRIKDYHLYITARNYGTFLSVMWALTVEPGFFKKAFINYIPGVANVVFPSLDFYAQQELEMCVAAVHEAVKDAVATVMVDLKQEFSKINTRSKGMVEVW